MKVFVIESGSGGNATLISYKDTNILIDVGISYSKLCGKLDEIGLSASDIDALFITHTHADHIKGLKVFTVRNKVPIYLTEKMHDSLNCEIKNKEFIKNKDIEIGDLKIKTIKTSHDTTSSLGYIITGNKEIVYVTDTGYLNQKYFDDIANKDMYIFESNHDIEMLLNGRYPHFLKQRVLSDKGHLSNKDSAYYLSKLVGDKTSHIVLAHISKDNNTEELALGTLHEYLEKEKKEVKNVKCARQEESLYIEV